MNINIVGVSCKNNCGFYGTEEQKGYCSLCYQKNTFGQNISKFSTFERKKRQRSENKRLKHYLLPSSSSLLNTSRSKNETYENQDLQKLDEIYRREFNKYGLEVNSLVYELSKNFCVELKKLFQKKSFDDISIPLDELYKKIEKTITYNDTFKDIPIDMKNDLIQFVEDLSMTRLYNSIFHQFATKYEEEDLALQKRIHSLNWINSYHLDSAINVTSLEVRQLVYLAISFLLSVDSSKTPNRKLEAISKCSSQIRTMILKLQGTPIGADQFLPALIFVVLKANPVRPISNIRYIQKMCNENRVMKGENSYLFTSLLCAISFIENLTAKNLNISEFEFNGYLSGKITPISAWDSTLVACEGMFHLNNTIDEVKNLTKIVTRIQADATTLQINLLSFKDDIKKQVTEIKSRTPFEIREIRRFPPVRCMDKKEVSNQILNQENNKENKISFNFKSNQEISDDENDNGVLNKTEHFYNKNLQLHLQKRKQPFEEKDSRLINNKTDENNELSTSMSMNSQLNFHALDTISLLSIDEIGQCSSNNLSLSDINCEFNLSNSNSSSNDDKIEDNENDSLLLKKNLNEIPNNLEEFTKTNEEKNQQQDYFSIASTSSTTSLSAINKSHYVGFSKQGFTIPSIPCNIDSKLSKTINLNKS